MSENSRVVLPAEFVLSNGISVSVKDISSHYFGGYFHVRLLVTADVTLNVKHFKESDAYINAVDLMGEVVQFKRVLEKMAVPQESAAIAKEQLLGSFQENLLPYLDRPDFAARFVCSQYERILNSKNKLRSRIS
jgi:hypothetical protein